MWAERLDDCTDPSDFAYCACKIYSCGYSQPNRTHISRAWLESGAAEADCSSLVNWCLYVGGFLPENVWFHTKIEREYLAGQGFDLIDANQGFVAMERNDVLWKPGHTALYIGEGYQAEAIRDENHDAGYEGTTPGDQDGGETVVRRLTLDWDYVIRKRDQPKPVAPIPTDTEEDMTFIFSCDSNRHMWLYDGGRVVLIKTESQQEALKEAHLKATGRPMPQFHLAHGGALIDLLG